MMNANLRQKLVPIITRRKKPSESMQNLSSIKAAFHNEQLEPCQKDMFERTREFLAKKLPLQCKLDSYLNETVESIRCSKRIDILLPSKLGHLFESYLVAANSRQAKLKTFPIEVAKLNLVTKIVLAKNRDLNKWLANLCNVIDQLKDCSIRYSKIVQEFQRRTRRRVLLLMQCLFGSLCLITRHSLTSKKDAEAVDSEILAHLLESLNDLQVLTNAQKKYLIAQYQKICWLSGIRPNGKVLSMTQEKKTNLSKIEPRDGLSDCDEDKFDVDESAVDDDSVEIILTDEWYECIEQELVELKEKMILMIADGELCVEKSFSRRSPCAELTDREVCIMCRKDRRGVLFMPCTHFLTCQDCANLLDECLICKEQISESIIIYWS